MTWSVYAAEIMLPQGDDVAITNHVGWNRFQGNAEVGIQGECRIRSGDYPGIHLRSKDATVEFLDNILETADVIDVTMCEDHPVQTLVPDQVTDTGDQRAGTHAGPGIDQNVLIRFDKVGVGIIRDRRPEYVDRHRYGID